MLILTAADKGVLFAELAALFLLQILTEQFRRMEAELVESRRQIEEEGQRWRDEAAGREAELAAWRLEQERLGAEQMEAGESSQAEQEKREAEARERQEAEDREVQRRLEDLSGLWGALWSLMERLPGREEHEEPSPLPPDPVRTIPALQAVLHAMEGRLDLLSTQNQEKETRCTELSHRLEQLQGECWTRVQLYWSLFFGLIKPFREQYDSDGLFYLRLFHYFFVIFVILTFAGSEGVFRDCGPPAQGLKASHWV